MSEQKVSETSLRKAAEIAGLAVCREDNPGELARIIAEALDGAFMEGYHMAEMMNLHKKARLTAAPTAESRDGGIGITG